MTGDFIWRDAGRTVVFRRSGMSQAPQLLKEHGFAPFELLASPRALASAPELAAEASLVHEVGPGSVPDLAGELIGAAEAASLVAVGGGRTIDVVKAVASVTGARVAAVPTTMSGAEMTGIHRAPAGFEAKLTSMVRPTLVVADPVAMTSQPEAQLRSSSMNALAHGIDSLYTPFANPVSELTALRGAELIAASLDQERAQRDPVPLAQGSLLCGYAIDSGMFGLHHVICQSLARVCGSPHAETNAAILPRAAVLLMERAPDRLAGLPAALSTDAEGIEARILELGGDPPGLGAAGADRSRLDRALDAILVRPELAFMPDPPGREELVRLIERAW